MSGGCRRKWRRPTSARGVKRSDGAGVRSERGSWRRSWHAHARVPKTTQTTSRRCPCHASPRSRLVFVGDSWIMPTRHLAEQPRHGAPSPTPPPASCHPTAQVSVARALISLLTAELGRADEERREEVQTYQERLEAQVRQPFYLMASTLHLSLRRHLRQPSILLASAFYLAIALSACSSALRQPSASSSVDPLEASRSHCNLAASAAASDTATAASDTAEPLTVLCTCHRRRSSARRS